jgi:hypothetical protein
MNFLIRRIVFTLLILIPVASSAADRSITEDREIKTVTLDKNQSDGKLKVGLVLGYPWGITAGYSFSNYFELNGTLGSDYNDFIAGVNGLFTVVNLKISHEIFPVSVGPAVYSHNNHHDDGNDRHGRDDEYTSVDLLGVARIEYSFEEIPLNLFIEAGLGVQVIEYAETAGSFSIGIRYIF